MSVSILSWRRIRVTLAASTAVGLLLSLSSLTPTVVVVLRAIILGLCALLAFGLFERWPARLLRWLGRWVLQLVAIAAVVPFGALLAYLLTTGGHPNFAHDRLRLAGWGTLTVAGVLFAPWIAVGAMFWQRDSFARDREMAFALERSELERKALDARFRLLQAQVEPHFLFNTLANVQTLVDTGAPQASKVLQSLIAYLRAAVPRLHEPGTTLGQELQLVRAYLDVMHMRMPDRLQFALHVEEGATELECPPMTLLTLVENAVRHGIDPSEVGAGVTGVEAACHIGRRAHLVFVTAYDQYAVEAFAQGVLDYLVKPVDAARLANTVSRLQERLRDAKPALNTEALLQQLSAHLERRSAPAPLRWIRASVGQTVNLIPVTDIDFLRAEEKYTVVAWCDAAGEPREAVIRTPLKEMTTQLDVTQFAQVHRSVVVNMSSIARVVRGSNETAEIHLKGRADVLPVSRSYLHLFRQM